MKDQKAFEKGLLEKTKQTQDVILFDNRCVCFKPESDVMLYVVGGADEVRAKRLIRRIPC